MKKEKSSKIRIYLKGYDHRLLDKSAKKITEIVDKAGSKISGPIPLPTSIKRYTVMKAPHVHKTAREQFEMRIHKRMLEVVDFTPKTLNVLSSFSLPSGVGIEIKQK